MSDTKVGALAPPRAKRDAIHIAVAPVTAGESLDPGQHVGLAPDEINVVVPAGMHGGKEVEALGIVDPFLLEPVWTGQRFFLWLYPSTVTGMRHEWQHPAFDTEAVLDALAGTSESQKWLEFAEEVGISYAELLQGCRRGYITLSYEGYEYNDRAEEMWKHYEKVTGETVADPTEGIFRCSC